MPRILISPRVGRNRPASRFISVLLPDPFGPTRLVIPGSIVRSTRVDAQHVAVELRDIAQDDVAVVTGVAPAHETTSKARTRR